METIDAGQDFLVVVDYAHTPDSIRVVLRGARSLAAGRVIVVFGCGGDRDRRSVPHGAGRHVVRADLSVITTDNPRSKIRSPSSGDRPGAPRGGDYVSSPTGVTRSVSPCVEAKPATSW
jgi:hypothetical protein